MVGSQRPWDQAFLTFAKWKIAAVALIIVATSYTALRLLPQGWTVRNRPVCERTWPAFAVCLVVLAVWFRTAAIPYRLPLIVDAMSPEVRILHVQKSGLRFHETGIAVYRDSRFFIWENDRRLFQYRFEEGDGNGVLPPPLMPDAHALSCPPQPADLRPLIPKALRSWKADGWYMVDAKNRVCVFTSEVGTVPPKDVITVFQDVISFPLLERSTWPIADVCLGFCYDPPAGLHLANVNNRCYTDSSGSTVCR
jgi:hypothetical protein